MKDASMSRIGVDRAFRARGNRLVNSRSDRPPGIYRRRSPARRRRLRCLCILAAVVAGGCSVDDRIPVRGSGATFPNPIYQHWALEFNRSKLNARVDYQKKGSSAGIRDITKRHVHFGATDAPLNDEESQRRPDLLHIPTVAGAVAIIANLPVHPALDGPTVAAIYEGSVTRWNDPRIAGLNPGLDLPEQDIIAVRRADGSGTTFVFTSYLARVSKRFGETHGVAKSIKWPSHTLGAKGNDGLAQVVQNTEGSVGYVEHKFAEAAGIEPLPLINRAGRPVRPSVPAVLAATTTATVSDRLVVDAVDAPGAEAYPIAGFTYLLIYRDLTYLSAPRARGLMTYLKWTMDEGQTMAPGLGYAPLPDSLRARVFARLSEVKLQNEVPETLH